MIKLEDIPISAGQFYSKQNMSDRLPCGLPSGFELISFEPNIRGITSTDPVVLRNQWGQIIYQWPDDFIPDWVDVLNVCKSLGFV